VCLRLGCAPRSALQAIVRGLAPSGLSNLAPCQVGVATACQSPTPFLLAAARWWGLSGMQVLHQRIQNNHPFRPEEEKVEDGTVGQRFPCANSHLAAFTKVPGSCFPHPWGQVQLASRRPGPNSARLGGGHPPTLQKYNGRGGQGMGQSHSGWTETRDSQKE
jgi:hypothetical protein